MSQYELLVPIMRVYGAQPATALWRSIEIGALSRFGLPDGRGLDLGCGDGKLTDILLRNVGHRRLVGSDIDPLESQAAARYGFYEAVYTAAADSIPEDDGSFDFVLSNSVLEHIPDLQPVLREVARLLRPGGQFVFTVPSARFHSLLSGSKLFWISRAQYLKNLDNRLAHFHYLTAADWCSYCAEAGLKVESCLGYMSRREVQRCETLSRLTGGLLHTLSGKRLKPIEIQRALGLRALQNRAEIPHAPAQLIASLISAGLRPTEGNEWLPEAEAACLLVHGSRP